MNAGIFFALYPVMSRIKVSRSSLAACFFAIILASLAEAQTVSSTSASIPISSPSPTSVQSAAPLAPVGPTGSASEADISELAKFLSPYVYVMTKPTYVYNWHPASSDQDLSSNSSDPKSYAGLQTEAARYWSQQTSPTNTSDMFGTGLYASVDPVATQSYGGGSDLWELTQIKLSPGLRILDVNRDEGIMMPLDQSDLITRLGCPEAWKYDRLLGQMMNPQASLGYPKCEAAIKKLFKDHLKIDLFAYGYNATRFSECSKNDPDEQSAFVIINGSKIAPADVHVFNRLTKDDVEDRIRIQSLFYKASVDNSSSGNVQSGSNSSLTPSQLSAYLLAHDGAQYSSWTNNIANQSFASNGQWATTLCNQPVYALFPSIYNNPSQPVLSSSATLQCVQVTGSTTTAAGGVSITPSYPQNLSASHPPGNQSSQFLWQNLDGKPAMKDLGSWVQENIYGCGKTPPYMELRDLLAHMQSDQCSHPESGMDQVLGLARAAQSAASSTH